MFHYCPTESFHGIVSSKTIWLSNSEYANDPNENRLAYDLLAQISENSTDNIVKQFAKVVLELKFGIIDEMSSYVFCMSENKDDLNQWRVYADKGFGYMLALRPQYFLDNGFWNLLDQGITLPAFDRIYLSKCIYDVALQRHMVEELLRFFAA